MPPGYPRIVTNPQLMSVEKDHQAVLHCAARAEGMPPPNIYWLKDYIPVDISDPRITLDPDGRWIQEDAYVEGCGGSDDDDDDE